MIRLSLKNGSYQNAQMCIVTGPNIEIAIKLIRRLKSHFSKVGADASSPKSSESHNPTFISPIALPLKFITYLIVKLASRYTKL